ncbi:oxidoreductase [Colletotrichum truncatum]|uniref:Oxidoreductase n=1 Tax=Colletotrichum truncatum TaxID=5467 RepID=A0ACC3ZGL3_COLTU|nr:oxidoreductase [Colletotrichum truncatum]KAF6784742.1 oxidoreductase [Colletotrichum truncatum]
MSDSTESPSACTPAANPNRLPAILCLHGQGTNGTIFSHQSQALVKSLSDRFRFIFIDSPFTSWQPGPGVIPVYADLKPYRRWHYDKAQIETGVSAEAVDVERARVRALISRHFETESEKTGEGIVGIMAFSHGTRVATGMCLDDELGPHIKIAILISPVFPCLSVGASTDSPEDGKIRRNLDVRLVQVHGTSDPWAPGGNRLVRTHFSASLTRTVTFTGSHQVPSAARDVATVAREVISAWELGEMS